jgi:hypothetical protein
VARCRVWRCITGSSAAIRGPTPRELDHAVLGTPCQSAWPLRPINGTWSCCPLPGRDGTQLGRGCFIAGLLLDRLAARMSIDSVYCVLVHYTSARTRKPTEKATLRSGCGHLPGQHECARVCPAPTQGRSGGALGRAGERELEAHGLRSRARTRFSSITRITTRS